MDLISAYPTIKHAHLTLLAISIPFFIARGGSMLMGLTWQTSKWVKICPHILDSLLLVSGVCLIVATGIYPIESYWLTSKLVFLVAYILCGIKTMRSSHIMTQRGYFALSLICICMMITIAKTHHPLGLFSLL